MGSNLPKEFAREEGSLAPVLFEPITISYQDGLNYDRAVPDDTSSVNPSPEIGEPYNSFGRALLERPMFESGLRTQTEADCDR